MKIYAFSIRMPGRNGSPSQFLIGGHECESLMSLTEELNSNDFIIVSQYFERDGELQDVGETILNHEVVGKVREWKRRTEHGSTAD